MKKKIKADSNYLWIPVSSGKEVKEISIHVNGEKQWEFRIPMDHTISGEYPTNYYAAIRISNYMQQELELEGDFSEAFMASVRLENGLPKAADTHPVIHFAARNGWINDPNGLYYQDGLYHMYFQYNEFNTEWENMSWGHAVSKDLLHWEQKDTVLYPDAFGTIYSGSAILNEQGLLGLPKDVPLYFYTAAGGRNTWSGEKKFTQKLAYSTDRGETLIKTGKVLVEHIVEENRDPKVYWHEETESYYMILYLDGFDYAVFTSKNLEDWEQTQQLTLDQCWECPDLRQIPCENGEKRWLFWCADGFYMTTDFDGAKMTALSERKEAYKKTKLPYAAQTFYGTGERVIIIPWMRMKNSASMYTGMMGLPRELKLLIRDGEEILSMCPVEEYFKARKEVTLPFVSETDAAVELKLTMKENEKAAVMVFDCLYEYDGATGILSAAGEKVELEKNLKELSLLIDRELVEISAKENTFYSALETKNSKTKGSICLAETNESKDITVYVIY